LRVTRAESVRGKFEWRPPRTIDCLAASLLTGRLRRILRDGRQTGCAVNHWHFSSKLAAGGSTSIRAEPLRRCRPKSAWILRSWALRFPIPARDWALL